MKSSASKPSVWLLRTKTVFYLGIGKGVFVYGFKLNPTFHHFLQLRLHYCYELTGSTAR